MSDTSKTEADFANILNEAFGRGSIHAELENSDYLSHHLKADEKMAAYREWRDAKARELAAVTAERDALLAAIEQHNAGCESACAARVVGADKRPCRDTYHGRMCPDCPRDWTIETALRGKEGEK